MKKLFSAVMIAFVCVSAVSSVFAQTGNAADTSNRLKNPTVINNKTFNNTYHYHFGDTTKKAQKAGTAPIPQALRFIGVDVSQRIKGAQYPVFEYVKVNVEAFVAIMQVSDKFIFCALLLFFAIAIIRKRKDILGIKNPS